MKYKLFIIILLFPFEALLAQPDSSGSITKDYWWEPGTKADVFSWKAQWIWMDESIDSDVMLARRYFDLRKKPESALLRITATSQYQLYINGKYVCRGPARSAPHHQSFDVLDIQDLLQAGKNIIAVRVHYQKGKRSYHQSGRPGFLAQLEMMTNGEKSSIITNNGWKVAPDLSWDNSAPRINRFQLVVGDKIDLRNKMKDWNTVSFEDISWANATPLMRKEGWPAPQKNAHAQALTPPWTSLVPRDVPYLIETEERAVYLIEAKTIKSDTIAFSGLVSENIAKDIPEYKKGSKSLVIPEPNNSESQFVLFDFGRVLNGMAKLDIQGSAGTIVEVLSAPYLINNTFTSQVVDSDFRDRIILSGERDLWEATYFKPTRYLGIAVRNGKEAVNLYSAGIRYLSYPFEERGHIHSSDAPWIDQYMKASAKTIHVCTTDGYTDNYRERRQYAQTGYYAALGNYWLFGDYALQRRYLVQVAQEQEANGIMPAYAPLATDDYMIILDSNCLWIRSLRNYFLYSGDTITVRELLPAARKLIALLHSYTNSLGFIYNPPYPYWLDHAQNDRRGANFCLNGHYLGALEDFAQILDWLDEPGEAEYLARADFLRRSLRKHLWDEEKALFADAWIDGKLSKEISEHANAMALALNVATEAQAQLIVSRLLMNDSHNYIYRASGLIMVTPAMSYFLHKGLCDNGYVDESITMFRQRFDKMLKPSTNGTLWEEWWLDGTGRSGKFQGGRTRSDAQTESAFPPALFGEYLLGVQPLEPGFRKVSLLHSPSGLNHVEGTVPTPEGDLFVQWSWKEDNHGELKIDIPGKMKVKLDLASLKVPSNQIFFLDGQELELEKQDTPYLMLSGGSHKVRW